MSLPKRNTTEAMNFPLQIEEDTEYFNDLEKEHAQYRFEELDPDYFSYQSGHLAGDSFQNLSKSDYAKVIFCDLYYNSDSTVGCRFQITDNVHEDPCDYIGLFRVGYDNLSQCLASKMLSHTDCEEDGKLLRCTFKPSELPELENGFYQFLYVTRDNEVCGASMPFHIKNSITKDLCSDEDVVAENSEDDFLVVRSNMAEKNRRLQAILDEMTEKCLSHESEMRKIQEKLKIISEEKIKLEKLFKQACEEKMVLFDEAKKAREEKSIICHEKEEAIHILKEKNKVFSTMFDNYSDKLKEFTELKDLLLTDKKNTLIANAKLQEQVKKLTEDVQNKDSILEREKEKKQELAVGWRKESSILASRLDDARLMIEALEKSKQLSLDELTSFTEEVAKLQEQLKAVKCENLVLKSQLNEAAIKQEQSKEKIIDMTSEIAALKLHIIEIHESKSSTTSLASGSRKPPKQESSSSEQTDDECHDLKKQQKIEVIHSLRMHQEKELCLMMQKKNAEDFSKMKISKLHIIPPNLNTSIQKEGEKLQDLKMHCVELYSKLEEKNATILKLKEELVKANGVLEYLSKEKESFQKNGSLVQDALNESILRLNEGSELYKKQYRKIEKLKKKLKKSKIDFMEKSSVNTSVKDSCSSVAESADELSTSGAHLTENQNSDSDTGEHVVQHPANVEKESAELQGASMSQILLPLATAVENEPSTPKIREVPELQTLIEMNLEKFKNSQSKDDEVLYSIPCPVCDQEVGVYMSSTDEMVKHLEVQHKQQICPICGRLFDMNLPPKYFVFHVEDHFVKENKE